MGKGGNSDDKGKAIIALLMSGLLLSGCSVSNSPTTAPRLQEQAAQGDWPSYTIDEMLNGKTDLVVVATVQSVQEISDEDLQGLDPGRSHQEAVLQIEDLILGQVDTDIVTLYQTVDRVETGTRYLLFLSYQPTIDQYVVSDGNSQVAIPAATSDKSEKELTVTIKGIEGQYSRNELRELLYQKAANKTGE